jgi:hypothetical protein
MTAALVLFLAATISGAKVPCDAYGSLYQSAFCLDRELRLPIKNYIPHAGDIILESDDRLTWKIGHWLSKSGYPHHSAIVFQRADGGFSILEGGSGEEDKSKVVIEDLMFHLNAKESKTGRKTKRIWIRQRRFPLTPEQSCALTSFACEAQGRRFARFRLFSLMTPIRAKGPVRTAYLGKPNLEKANYYCAELVTTSLVAAGLLDAELARPSATFPHDLFFGSSLNRFVSRGLAPLNCGWEPPARWTGREPMCCVEP